jgi:hypothetical protein
VVDPPDDVLTAIFESAGKSKGPIPVRGTLNGAGFIQTLVKFKGGWRLYINGAMLENSGLNVGDAATIEIEFDPEPRSVPMPERFAEALANDRKARTAFENLAPSRQKEILKYLGALKTSQALEKNVRLVLQQLRGL